MDTQNTPNQKQRSPFAHSRGSFTEYFSASPGQHFITVKAWIGGKQQFIGKIFREYDQEAKKYKYTAKNKQDNILFEPTHNLYEIKKQFIELEKILAPTLPQNQEKENRGAELDNVRKNKEEKSKGQELER